MAKICPKCGTELKEEDTFCTNCDATLDEKVETTVTEGKPKSKMAAGLLGIFLGCYGVHNFYLGYTGKAIAQLVLSVIGILTSWLIVGLIPLAAAGIWGLVEGIMILTGKINTDAKGNKLVD